MQESAGSEYTAKPTVSNLRKPSDSIACSSWFYCWVRTRESNGVNSREEFFIKNLGDVGIFRKYKEITAEALTVENNQKCGGGKKEEWVRQSLERQEQKRGTS